MTTLFDELIKDTYKDLIQLGLSGAGVPLGEGEEVLLKGGHGDPIASQLAVGHHLNAEQNGGGTSKIGADTEEFSTQSALAGWTDDTGIVSSLRNGRMVLDYTPDQSKDFIGAYQTVNLTGDFDFITINHGFGLMEVGQEVQRFMSAGLALVDSVNGKIQVICLAQVTDRTRTYHAVGATYPVGSISYNSENYYGDFATCVLRICRYSGTIYLAVGTPFSPGSNDVATVLALPVTDWGWRVDASVADANTYDRVYLGLGFTSTGTDIGGRAQFPFLRRYK